MNTLPDNMGKPLATTFIVCGVMIERDGKYLLVQENQQKAYGLWNLPGGKLDDGETFEEGAMREAKEECGLDVELIVGKKQIFHSSADAPVIHTFLARCEEGELLLPDNEIMDAKWYTKDEILKMKDMLRNPERIISAVEALAV